MDFTNNINHLRNHIPSIVGSVERSKDYKNLMLTSKIFNIESQLKKDERLKLHYKTMGIECYKCDRIAVKRLIFRYCDLHYELKLIEMNFDLDHRKVLENLVKMTVNKKILLEVMETVFHIIENANNDVKIIYHMRLYHYLSMIDKKYYYEDPDAVDINLSAMSKSLRALDGCVTIEEKQAKVELLELIKYMKMLKEEMEFVIT